jgi:hypothetical protein
MNTGNAPSGQSAQESSSPERVPLPAHTPPTAQPGQTRIDLLLAVGVVLLAFLVASTPVRHSDLWLHLATGRAIADGSYRFQGDPFSPETNASWIARSWLFDLVAYTLFTRLGGTVLVILKAVLVAVLAAVLVRLGVRGRGWTWPAVAATLSVLTLSSRLLLQPALLSVLLLAVTLWLLERGRHLRSHRGTGWLIAYGPIVVLFVLWANLDDWFLLGPLTVALYLLGETIAVIASPARSSSKGEERPLACAAGWYDLPLTLVVGLLASLLTPFHIRGFTPPTDLGLSATAATLKQDPVLGNLFISPFEKMYFHSFLTRSILGVAYLILVVLSGISFLVSRDGWRSWRLPVWLGLFGLSAWSARAIPFFAVAAGPILALNLSFPCAAGTTEFLFARLCRATAVLLMLGLLIAAWPGWLQGPPYEMRRWVVLADPSLREAADKLAEWWRYGRMAFGDYGFNFSPEEANYFAYFCPEEKGFLDARLSASHEAAADYVAVRRALLGQPSPPTANAAGWRDWRSIFRARRINHVTVYDSNLERVDSVFQRLIRDEREWKLIGLTGRTAIFSWKDPQHEVHALDIAFPLKEEAYQPSEALKAPPRWPGRQPEPPTWWRAFIKTRPANSVDREQAHMLLLDFDTRSQQNRLQRSLAWNASRLVGPIGAGAGSPALSVYLQQALDLYCYEFSTATTPQNVDQSKPTVETLAFVQRMNYLLTQDDAPPEYLWLAIRDARRALRDNPDDAHAYLTLGETYLRLLQGTRERVWRSRLPRLTRMRQVQASAALNQALIVQPDLLPAHDSLALLYQDMDLRDLSLMHRRDALRLARAQPRSEGESVKEYENRRVRLGDEEDRLNREMTRVQQRFEADTANLKTIDRVEQAVRNGLGGKALEILLASDAGSMGQRAIMLELSLLLRTGRVREVREWMSPDHRETLGDDIYLEDQLQLAAATGDYQQADALADELVALYDKPLRQAIAVSVANEVLQIRLDKPLALVQVALSYLHWPMDRRTAFSNLVQQSSGRLQQTADWMVLRGLLALERGETVPARMFLERALEVYHSGEGLDFGGRRIAEHFVKLLPTPRSSVSDASQKRRGP